MAPWSLPGRQSRRAGHMPTPPEEQEVGGRKGMGGRHGPHLTRGPSVRSARRVGSSSVPPASQHRPDQRVRRWEGAAPMGGCPEPRQGQAGSPPGCTPLNTVLVTLCVKAAAILEVQIKAHHHFQRTFLQYTLLFVLSMCRCP